MKVVEPVRFTEEEYLALWREQVKVGATLYPVLYGKQVNKKKKGDDE